MPKSAKSHVTGEQTMYTDVRNLANMAKAHLIHNPKVAAAVILSTAGIVNRGKYLKKLTNIIKKNPKIAATLLASVATASGAAHLVHKLLKNKSRKNFPLIENGQLSDDNDRVPAEFDKHTQSSTGGKTRKRRRSRHY